jgi:hypothetical protein
MFVAQLGTRRTDRLKPRVSPFAESLEFLPSMVNEAHRSETFVISKNISLLGFTKHKRSGIIYHSHPSYRKSGPWKYWCYAKFDDGHEYPSQI